MDLKQKILFHEYVLETKSPYSVNEKAIANKECLEFAKEIIELWDDYYFKIINTDVLIKADWKNHLEKYLQLLLRELDESSSIVQDVRIAIRNLECEDKINTNIIDHLIRIRAVFGL